MTTGPDRVTEQLEELANSYIETYDSLVASNQWPSPFDARPYLFNKCSSVFRSAFMFRIMTEQVMLRGEFWEKYFTRLPSTEELSSTRIQSGVFVSAGLMHFLFAIIESSFRLYVRALDAEACRKGTAEFQSVVRWLLKRVDLGSLEPLFDLLRNYRNTIHNNAVFISRREDDEIIEFEGDTYVFRHGQAVKFDRWFQIYSRVRSALEQIVTTSPIADVENIVDPAARNDESE